jgi:hypothetical protein
MIAHRPAAGARPQAGVGPGPCEDAGMPEPSALRQLLDLASPPLVSEPAAEPSDAHASLPLRATRNGWVAYFSALHVFPTHADGVTPDLGAVNRTLRAAYGDLATGHTAFAQDLFGVLFTGHPDGICAFDPETAEHELLAPDVEGWAHRVLAEPEELLGAAFAYDWQERNGALCASERLVPLLPFVLGGEYDDANLEPRETLLTLRERGALARRIAALPDGAEVDWPLPGTREDVPV